LDKKKKKKLIAKIVLACAALVLVFSAGYGLGLQHNFDSNSPSNIENSTAGKPTSVDFSLFWQTWHKVRELYHGSSDPQTMVYGAISGMVASLGDPYTEFLTPTNTQALSSDLSGQFEGIGAELTINDNQITVIAPLTSSPAEKAGIKVKDIVLQIDGTSTATMTLDQAVNKIRGTAGTSVKLQVQHSGSSQPVEISVTREKIDVPSVTYKLINVNNKKIVIISISQFGDSTNSLLEKYANQAISDRATGIILDLRNNPGGYLDSSVFAAGIFLPNDKLVVSEVDKDGQKQEYKTSGNPILKDSPLVVLVNGGSASAAEILTGAVQDNKRGEIIGEQTFGKGSVQQLVSLPGGSSLKVTIANWLTPNGSEINKVGIKPDIIVPLSESDQSASKDPQLDRAKTEVVK